eukprot:scaffold48344_cov19-Tisochrysis_lutea.AAC.1
MLKSITTARVAGLLPQAGLWGAATPSAAGQCREMASSGVCLAEKKSLRRMRKLSLHQFSEKSRESPPPRKATVLNFICF